MTDREHPQNAPLAWRTIRERAGLTAVALAARFEVAPITVRRFESADKSMGNLTRARLELLYRDLDRLTRARLESTAGTEVTK